LQTGTASADGHGPEQQEAKTKGEDGVAFVDGILRIPQQMRETELAHVAMTGLCGVAVGHPHLRLTAVEDSRTHCHQLWPPTRAEVSSEPTTALVRTAAAIGAAAASSGVAARARMLTIAPSLIVTPNTSANSRARRSKPIAWVLWRWMISARSPGPNGEPDSSPAGTGATIR